MSSSRNDKQHLDKLFADVLSADEVSPQQLLRYLENPQSLSHEEREFIETQLAASPALADQLRVLQTFDVAGATAVFERKRRVQAGPGLLAQGLQSLRDTFDRLSANGWLPAGAVAAIAISVTVAVLMSMPDQPETLIADDGIDNSVKENTTGGPAEREPDKDEIPIWERTAQLAENDTTEPDIQRRAESPDATGSAVGQQENTGNAIPQDSGLLLAMVEPQYISGYDAGQKTVLRGQSDEIVCLAPPLANVLSVQPDLYWFISEIPAKATFTFELNNETTGELLVSQTLSAPERSGVQKISLADMNITLATGDHYQWSVIMQTDPDNPALDKFASAGITRVSGDADFSVALHTALTNNRANVYARNGYWYDALDEVIELRNKYPENKSVQTAYQSLLSQGGFQL